MNYVELSRFIFLVFCILVSASQSKLHKEKNYYFTKTSLDSVVPLDVAIELQEYNYRIEDYKSCLLKDIVQNDSPNAAYKMGFGHLFGFPFKKMEPVPEELKEKIRKYCSMNDNFLLLDSLDMFTEIDPLPEYSFNITRAIFYLNQAAHHGSADAKVLLYFISIQSLIFEWPDQVDFGEQEKPKRDLFMLLDRAQLDRSNFARILLSNKIYSCEVRNILFSDSESEFSRVLDDNLMLNVSQPFDLLAGDFIRAPYFDEKCDECPTALSLMNTVGNKIIKFIHEQGGYSGRNPPLNGEVEQSGFVDFWAETPIDQMDQGSPSETEMEAESERERGASFGNEVDVVREETGILPSFSKMVPESVKSGFSFFGGTNQTKTALDEDPEVLLSFSPS